ncbi:uncharacterized protein BDW43DRAFT_145464 [Aspergillus alliaceus]|uniref:uncharacterized protein n=1 Tax=Petromyces alliaceus TaxID=209559 RepID=UPI0012A54724|nr:uncharacterized protein BDW43DRAFT_145464 [Aspergillus alliaceus]KAB8231080.1 hypothetical protein BDW43DRAFT_145464 [Aspergillus alliaceus]
MLHRSDRLRYSPPEPQRRCLPLCSWGAVALLARHDAGIRSRRGKSLHSRMLGVLLHNSALADTCVTSWDS